MKDTGAASRADAKRIVVVGAGIAGLAAGIYARRNGYAVTICEAHDLPGGLCTAWRRRGYTFEGCLHYIQLIGTSREHVFHPLWQELGVFPGTKVIQHEVFHTFRDAAGRTLNLYANADRLEEELCRLSPADATEIASFCRGIRRYAWLVRRAGAHPARLAGKALGLLRVIPLLRKYGSLTLAEYAARFRDPLIRDALSHVFVHPDFASPSLFFILAGWHIGAVGYPQGGGLVLAQTIERTFQECGGTIAYRSKVARVQVTDGRATGVVLEDGTLVTADVVISAADVHSTLSDLLEDRFTPPALRERFASQPLYPSFVQVSLGVSRDMSGMPHALKAQVAVPFEVAGQTRRELWLQHFAFDPTTAPPGKTSITVLYPSDLAWWQELGRGSTRYEAEKQRILDTTLAQLEHLLPGVTSQVEATDVATPCTYLRYTGTWRGAAGFMLTKDLAATMVRRPQYELPGLDRFYMVGQWVKGFGTPMAAMSGREVIGRVCRADGRRFRAAPARATG